MKKSSSAKKIKHKFMRYINGIKHVIEADSMKDAKKKIAKLTKSKK